VSIKSQDSKVAIVSGGASGMGKAVAQQFAGLGARVVISDLISSSGEALAASIRDAGGEAIFVAANVAVEDEVEKLVATTLERYGRLDWAANMAGVAQAGGLFCPKSARDLAMSVNAMGTFHCVTAEARAMMRSGGGAIVNVSSVATRGVNRVPYGAAKGGVNALTACLALETAGSGIRVNATAPGGTEAPPRRIPRNSQPQSDQERVWYQQIVDQTLDSSLMKRYGSIDEQAGAILFLASDEASYITGVSLPVGGGDLG